LLGYHNNSLLQNIYEDSSPLLLPDVTSIDLSFEKSALSYYGMGRKSIGTDFDEFAKASLIPYTWNWVERLIIAPTNVKQVYTDHITGWFHNISGWQGCKRGTCSKAKIRRSFWNPSLNDGDPITTNYVQRPISGMTTYLYYRAEGFDRTSATFGSLMQSFLFEYTIEGFQQPTSFNDIFVTPAIGVPLGMLA
jgi:Domain of unknown function (DUF3943)